MAWTRLRGESSCDFGPTLDVLAELLSVALAGDRALKYADDASLALSKYATTNDALTGIHNRLGWDKRIEALDCDFATYADPSAIVVVQVRDLVEGQRRLGWLRRW